jgi:hypothetical protein
MCAYWDESQGADVGVNDVRRLRVALAPAGAGHGPRGQGQKRGSWACVAFLEPRMSDWFRCALACLGRASVKEQLWVGLSHHWARRHPPRRQASRLQRWVVPCPRVRCKRLPESAVPGVQALEAWVRRTLSATQPMRPVGKQVWQPGTGRALLPYSSASLLRACRGTSRRRVMPSWPDFRRNPWCRPRLRLRRPGRVVTRRRQFLSASQSPARRCVAMRPLECVQ